MNDDLPVSGGTLRAPASGPFVRAQRYLQPAEVYAPLEATEVKTILGSCISVCLWDARSRLGGINHFLLPIGSANVDRPGRFGNFALPLLYDALLQNGASEAEMSAKVFGGAAMFVASPKLNHIGAQNLQVALAWLSRAQIPVVASDVGGSRGRKLVFNTDDGSVALWEL
jgi:chemotaxis protein CheD